jgi:hypothetical protein
MALSRAAAAAARKAAKSRGLQGNRAKDGSMLSETPFAEKRRSVILEELGGDEKGRYPDIDENNPVEVQKELAKIQEDIEYWEDAINALEEDNYDAFEGGPFNDFEIGLVQTQLRRLRNREAELQDLLVPERREIFGDDKIPF